MIGIWTLFGLGICEVTYKSSLVCLHSIIRRRNATFCPSWKTLELYEAPYKEKSSELLWPNALECGCLLIDQALVYTAQSLMKLFIMLTQCNAVWSSVLLSLSPFWSSGVCTFFNQCVLHQDSAVHVIPKLISVYFMQSKNFIYCVLCQLFIIIFIVITNVFSCVDINAYWNIELTARNFWCIDFCHIFACVG